MTMTAIPYGTGLTRANIEAALRSAGKEPERLVPSDLAMLEDFHSLGRFATAALLNLAQITPADRVLDGGTGIGGTARLIAAEYGAHVTGIDLTAEYCDVARWLNQAVGLEERVDVHHGDVTALPYAPDSFDVVVSQHVQMNVADKTALYREAHRVLAPGGRLAIWDVVAGNGAPSFPLPWATAPEQSHLIDPAELGELLSELGFVPQHWNDLTASAGPAMEAFFTAEPPPLGLQVFVPDFPQKLSNLTCALEEGQVRLLQAVLVAA